MKYAFYLIIFLLSAQVWADQPTSTGPVYNFNFSNGASSTNTITSPGTAISTAALSPNLTNTEVKKEQSSSMKNPFSRSLLDPNENYYGIIGTWLPAINKKNTAFKSLNAFSLNLISTSWLWGIKAVTGKSKFTETFADGTYDYYFDTNNFDAIYYQVGLNKFIPLMDHLALELGAFYEKGEIDQQGTSMFDGNYNSKKLSYKAGNASVGLNAFVGNLIVGLQYQSRFAFTPVDKNSNVHENIDFFMKERALRLNLGFYF